MADSLQYEQSHESLLDHGRVASLAGASAQFQRGVLLTNELLRSPAFGPWALEIVVSRNAFVLFGSSKPFETSAGGFFCDPICAVILRHPKSIALFQRGSLGARKQ